MPSLSLRDFQKSDQRWQALLEQLEQRWPTLDAADAWPGEQLALCAECGVFEWFVPTQWGGQGWSDADLQRMYLQLSRACLTTAFVLTQRVAAVTRIVAGENERLKSALLPPLLTAETFATVGISHLTTSHRHVAKPVLRAEQIPDGFILDGFSPWVTGAPQADTIVMGATLDDGRQVLVALDTKLPGVRVAPPELLVALSASQTGRVDCQQVRVPLDRIIAGPVENVMQRGLNAGTGGLTTSTLAIGTADRALRLLEGEAAKRSDLLAPAEALRHEWHDLQNDLLRLADNLPACTTESLRQRANSLVLRASEAALAAAKGAGYVAGHPAGRLCREALFFLVWSCPQPVTTAHLCELAGLH